MYCKDVFKQKMGVRSFKRELLPLAVYVTQTDRVSLYSMYNYLKNDTLYESQSWDRWVQQWQEPACQEHR